MTNSNQDTASNESLRCSRGDFLKTGALLGAATLLPTNSVFAQSVLQSPFDKLVDDGGQFVHGPLPYAVDALEPHMDTETLELHHTFHHGGAVKGANTDVAKIIDVWEHAYYLKHRNRRGDFVNALFDLLDWDNARARLEAARKLAG